MVLFFVFSFLIGGSSSFCFFLLPLSMFSSTFSVSFFSIFTKTDKGVGHHFISRNLALIDASLGSEGCHALGLS